MFEYFDPELTQDEVHNFLVKGCYAFQDYAILHWVDHAETYLQIAEPEDQLDVDYISTQIKEFSEMFMKGQHELEEAANSVEEDPQVSSSADLVIPLTKLVNRTREARSADGNNNALGSLAEVFFNIRSMLEHLAESPKLEPSTKANLRIYYGQNWFKCPRHLCFYFHEGFPSAKLRDHHVNRHERPFCCTELGCLRVQIGFSSDIELKKHMANVHPDPEALAWKFLKIREQKPPKWFQCTVCPRKFKRAHSLRIHTRTHNNERPFQCATCSKAFARKNDCIRHEDLHTGSGKHVCAGEGENGEKWGCGRQFARSEALIAHLANSEGGQVCRKQKAGAQSHKRADGAQGAYAYEQAVFSISRRMIH